MTTDSATHSDPDPGQMDAEDYPETDAGTSHGAGDAETELVPPATVVRPTHAWSWEEPDTEALTSSRPWRSVWAIAGIGLMCAVVVAFAVFGVVALLSRNAGAFHHATPRTLKDSASVPGSQSPGPSQAVSPSVSAPPQAARSDDDEFVALALSPRALSSEHHAGFGTSGTQDRANQIALSECRAASGNDDCLLVNAGMFHGCVGYAVDSSRSSWASGSGPAADTALADALRRLGGPAAFAYAQCSDPPGIIRSAVPSNQAALLPSSASVTPETLRRSRVLDDGDGAAAASPLPNPIAAEDQNLLSRLRANGWSITNPQIMVNNAHEVCRRFKLGERSKQVNDELAAATGLRMDATLNFTSNVLLTYSDC
jgi:hypothetical protein